MNLKQLKDRIDFLYKISRNPEQINVYITTSDKSISGRAKCGIKGVHLGFDWEHNQLRIDPEDKLIKKDEV